MSEVKWIKLQTDIFDNRKIKQLERMPDGDALIVIWLKILALAGSVNDGGLVYFTRDVPYTDQLLAAEFNRPLPTVQLALEMFEKFGMIEVVNDLIHVSNWEKYQNVESLERVREQTRNRVAAYRERKALTGNVTSNVTVTLGNATDIDTEEEKETEEDKKSTPFAAVVEAWNALGLSPIRRITGERERLLKARIKEYGEDGVLEAISKIRTSDFLQGHGYRGWTITFDWFLGPRNFAKVLEGNYDNKEGTAKEEQPKKRPPSYMSSSPQKLYSSDEWDKIMERL